MSKSQPKKLTIELSVDALSDILYGKEGLVSLEMDMKEIANGISHKTTKYALLGILAKLKQISKNIDEWGKCG